MQLRKIFPIVSVASAVLAGACSIDSPTAPSRPLVEASTAALSPAEKAALVATKDSVKAAHDRLTVTRDSIRKLQHDTKEKNKAAFTVLKKEWDAWKKQWAEYKKDNKDAKVELLRCAPLEYAGAAEIIGPNGGEIHVGPHKLVVPKGALSEEHLVVAEAPMGSLVQVLFEPHGLQFSTPSELTLSYAHCMRPDAYTYRIVYTDDNAKTILEFPPSSDDKTLQAVHAPINHFSSYIIAY